MELSELLNLNTCENCIYLRQEIDRNYRMWSICDLEKEKTVFVQGAIVSISPNYISPTGCPAKKVEL